MSEAVQTTADFLRVVRASGLVEAEKLDPVVAPWEADGGPVPDQLVAALVGGELLTTWQVEQIRRGRHKGFLLGKYKLLRLLGTGGMSSVYLAEHATLHTKWAIKVLPVKRVDQSSYLARFEREAQASSRLDHPHIARAFDLDTSGAIHFIVMEYIEGEDLHTRVKEHGPLPIRDAAEFIRQTALGLQYAHEEGLVHRDIKPANLIVDKRGRVKILDLGLALAGAEEEKEEEEDASLTREHDEKVLGTADYLAPEQARDSHKADRRSDIYSLGCTLFYLLVGKPPYHKGSLAQRIRAHLNEPAPNILDFRADVPPAIAELYFRMLEKHPDARQQTAQEVADALETWLKTNPATPSRGSRAEPPPRRSDLRRGSPQPTEAVPRRAATAGDGGGGQGDSSVGIGGEPAASGGGSGSGSTAGSHVQPGGESSIGRGRDGSGRRSGSGIDPQSLSLTPPPSSPARSTARLPKLGRPASTPTFPTASLPTATGDGGFKIDITAAPSKPAAAPKPAATKPVAARSPASGAAGVQPTLARKVYGLPLVAWLGIGGGLLAAVALAAWLLLAGPDEPAKGESRPGKAAKQPVKKEDAAPPVRRRRAPPKKPGE